MDTMILWFALTAGMTQQQSVSVLSQHCVDLHNAEYAVIVQMQKHPNDPNYPQWLAQAQATEQALAACQKALLNPPCPKAPCDAK